MVFITSFGKVEEAGEKIGTLPKIQIHTHLAHFLLCRMQSVNSRRSDDSRRENKNYCGRNIGDGERVGVAGDLFRLPTRLLFPFLFKLKSRLVRFPFKDEAA